MHAKNSSQGQEASFIRHLASLSIFFGLLTMGIGASWLPWIYRKPAALWLTAPDLAEFIKFLPEVRKGEIHPFRQAFLLLLFIACLGMAFSLPNKHLKLPRILRWFSILLIIPFALTLLPPVWSPANLISSEFLPQTLAASFCLLLLPLYPLIQHVPFRPLAMATCFLTFAGISTALWQFATVRAAVETAYQSQISLDWGGWISIFGGVILIGGCISSMAWRNRD